MAECRSSSAEAIGKNVSEEASVKDVPFSGTGKKIKQPGLVGKR